MEQKIKHFSELSAEELYEIYKLRVSVFVVEQQCPYQEADDAARVAYHLWLQEEGKIVAYARVLPQGAVFPDICAKLEVFAVVFHHLTPALIFGVRRRKSDLF